MYYEIYIDQLFFENVLILALLVKICGKWMKVALTWKRIWLTSVSGAAALCAVIFFRPKGMLLAKPAGLVLSLMFASWIGLGQIGWKAVFRGGLFLLTATALFGGVFQIIFSIWEPPVLLAAALAYTAIDFLIRRQTKHVALGECQVRITLEDQGSRWELTGLIDTGNHLTEPLTGRPVSILERQEAVKLQRFCRIQREECGYLYIPYHSIGMEKGWLMGMVIDAMYMNYRGEEIRISHPVLAVSQEKLSPDGRYQLIINPQHVR